MGRADPKETHQMIAEGKTNPATRAGNTAMIYGSGVRKTSAACAEWTAKENWPATSEPPPEKVEHRKLKG